MKISLSRPTFLAGAAVLLGVAALANPAAAQRVPGGSYLESCSNARMFGDRLVAECRRMDGRWTRSEVDANRCVGGIANSNGQLTCNQGRTFSDRDRDRDGRGDRDWRREREWSRDRDWDRDRREGYGSSRPYEPSSPYGSYYNYR